MGTPWTACKLCRTVVFGVSIAWLTAPVCQAQSPDDANTIRLADHKSTSKGPQYPKVLEEGNSTAAVRKQAVAAVPLSEVEESKRPRVEEILNSISFFRRLPTLQFAVHPEVYDFFISHPDAAVSLWRVMQISKVQMSQISKMEYEADVGDGSTGAIEILVKTPTKAVVLCDGIYKSPIVKRSISAKSLVVLDTRFVKGPDGALTVIHRADVFVSFPSATIDVVAKIFSPLTVSLCDSTFSEISLFLKMMSAAMVRRPDWVEELVGKMDGVLERRRTELLRLTSQVYTAHQKQQSADSTGDDRQPLVQRTQSQVQPVREVRR